MTTTYKREINLSDYSTTDAVKALHEIGGDVIRGDRKSGARWFGVHSMSNLAATVALVLRNGDLASTERVRTALKSAAVSVPAARSQKPVRATGRYAGVRVDVDRALHGRPDAWGRFERTNAHGSKTVAIYLPIGGNSGLSALEIAWSPVAAIVVTDLLEAAGSRCEVWAAAHVEASEGGNGDIHERINLKRAQDPCDLHAISRVCHPALYRALVMPIRWVHTGGACGDGYGCTVELDPAAWGDDNAVALRHCYDLDSTLSEIARVAKLFA